MSMFKLGSSTIVHKLRKFIGVNFVTKVNDVTKLSVTVCPDLSTVS